MKEFNMMVEAYGKDDNVFLLWLSFTTVQRRGVAEYLKVDFNYTLILEKVIDKHYEI